MLNSTSSDSKNKSPYDQWISFIQSNDLKKVFKGLQSNPSWVNQCSHKGMTPLEIAFGDYSFTTNSHINIKMIDLLLNHGADPFAVLRKKDNYLIHSIYRKNLPTFQTFLNLGLPLDHQNEEGNHALLVAIRFKNFEAFQALIQNGAPVNLTNFNKKTPLMVAAFQEQENMIRVLLDQNVDVNAQDCFGKTALMYAASRKSPTIMKMLFEAGADLNIKDNQGKTVFHFAQDKFLSNTQIQNWANDELQLLINYFYSEIERQKLSNVFKQESSTDCSKKILRI